MGCSNSKGAAIACEHHHQRQRQEQPLGSTHSFTDCHHDNSAAFSASSDRSLSSTNAVAACTVKRELHWSQVVKGLRCIKVWTVSRECLCLRFSMEGIEMRHWRRALVNDLGLLEAFRQQNEAAMDHITSLCVYCRQSFPNRAITLAMQRIMPLLPNTEDVFVAWDTPARVNLKVCGFPVRALLPIMEHAATNLQSVESTMRLLGTPRDFSDFQRTLQAKCPQAKCSLP